MSVAAYPEYRDSGVEWLGAVPAHWHIDRFKASVGDCRNGLWGDEPDGSGNDIVCVRVADFNRVALSVDLGNPTYRSVTPAEAASRLVERGHLLLEKSGGGEGQPVGVVVLYENDTPAICSNFVARMRLRCDQFPGYWKYAHAAAYALRITVRSIKQTSGIQNLDQSQYFEERAPFPPLAEQIAIASFLDRETGKIDALVEEQRRLIALLKEKRQAVISHAVIKGLDPNAPMKDSGVEWLGEVPAHWEVNRLGSMFYEASEPGLDELPVLSVSIHHGVSDKELDPDDMDRKVTRSDDRTKYKQVQVNDLVYNMMRAWQGGFGTVRVNGMVSPAYVVARPFAGTSTQYVEQLLRTPNAVEEMRRHSRGVTDFRLRLYWDEFKCIRIGWPPHSEQETILTLVNFEIARSQALIVEAESAIELLAERRVALISAAVTGKIDVRDLAPQLLEVA